MERLCATDGVVVYRSPRLTRLGVPHGFSTRIGGISGGPFASLNLGNPSGCSEQDDWENIRANYARLHTAIGCAGRSRWSAHQVHGRVVANPDGRAYDCATKADAVVCTDPTAVASVRTADCVPFC